MRLRIAMRSLLLREERIADEISALFIEIGNHKIKALIEEVHLEHAIVFRSHTETVTPADKNDIWKRITERVNYFGVAARTQDSV